MGNIYHTLWNESAGTWVNAGEIAKFQSKKSKVFLMTESNVKFYLSALTMIMLSVGLNGFLASDVQATEIGSAFVDTSGTNANAGNPFDIAIGPNATTTNTSPGEIAIGWNSFSNVVVNAGGYSQAAVAMGYNAYAAGGVAIGDAANNGRTMANISTAIGSGSTAGGLGSVAIGTHQNNKTMATANNTIAVGNGAIANAQGATALGAGMDVLDAGAKATAQFATALGNSSLANDVYATAVGSQSSATGANSVAVGSYASASVAGGVALGNNSSVTQAGGVALGQGSVANTAAGILGYVPTGATAADKATIDATVAANAAVDVGSRQITSVAAGTADSDAVNVSQLKAVANMAQAPLIFAGDTGSDVNRQLGQTVNLVGGSMGSLTDGNIGVVANGTDTLTIKLASDLSGLSSVSITNGPTINNNGIDMGGDKITNLAPGVADTDAVNVSQLKNVANQVGKVEDKLSGGIAASAAMAVVTPVEPGTYHLSGGAAYYNGGYGVGFNLLKRSDNGRTTMHAGVGWGSGGGGALVRIGAGFSFGGN